MSTAQSSLPASQASESSRISFSLSTRAWLCVAIAVAHLPLLGRYFQNLWEVPHYQFFPIALLGVIALVVREGRAWRNSPTPPSNLFAGICWILDAGLIAGGILINSPWLVMVGSIVAGIGAALFLGGFGLLKKMIPALVVYTVMLRLPLRFDLWLVDLMQGLTTTWATTTLDVLKVTFLPTGNVIELTSRQLFVAEACSGMNSLFVLMAATLWYLYWMRTGWFRGLFALLTLPLWVLCANTLRVTTVVMLEDRWGIQADSGWIHELIGLGTFSLTLFLLWGVDGFASLLQSGFNAMREARKKSHRGYIPQSASPRKKSPRPVGVVPVPVILLVGIPLISAVLLLGQLGRSQLLAGLSQKNSTRISVPVLGENFLPEEYLGWKRQEYTNDSKGLLIREGVKSQIWSYAGNQHSVQAAINYPFDNWHELTNCYERIGWQITNRELVEQQGNRYVQVHLEHPGQNQYGLLLFSLMDSQGELLSPPAVPKHTRAMDRFQISSHPTVQLQIFSNGFVPYSEEQVSQLVEFLEELQSQTRKLVLTSQQQ